MQLAGERRTVLPIYSLMIATEPLDDATWGAIGLHDRPTFHDGRHMIIYGQRTADGRIAFGGRGAPYHFGIRGPARVRHRRAGAPAAPPTRSASCSRCSATPRSRTAGAALWQRPRLVVLRAVRPSHRVRHGRRATSATAWGPPTWPAAHSPISSPGATPTTTASSSGSRGWGTAPDAGSPNRCAGSGSTAPASRLPRRRCHRGQDRPPEPPVGPHHRPSCSGTDARRGRPRQAEGPDRRTCRGARWRRASRRGTSSRSTPLTSSIVAMKSSVVAASSSLCAPTTLAVGEEGVVADRESQGVEHQRATVVRSRSRTASSGRG